MLAALNPRVALKCRVLLFVATECYGGRVPVERGLGGEAGEEEGGFLHWKKQTDARPLFRALQTRVRKMLDLLCIASYSLNFYDFFFGSSFELIEHENT